MRYVGDCEDCGDPVYKHEAAWPITGWEVAHTTGGPNQIRHRERIPNIVAHAVPCMDKLVRKQTSGNSGEQESLLG